MWLKPCTNNSVFIILDFLSIVFPALISQGYCDHEALLLFFPGPGFILPLGPITATQFPRCRPGLFCRASLRSQPRREGAAGGRDWAGLPSTHGHHRPPENWPAKSRAGQWASLWNMSWDSFGGRDAMLRFSPPSLVYHRGRSMKCMLGCQYRTCTSWTHLTTIIFCTITKNFCC